MWCHPITINRVTERYFAKHKIPVRTSDTIMAIDFYISKNTTNLGQSGHQFGLTHINKISNIIYVDKVDKETNTKLMFRVYKWTKSEIILKDITADRPNRIYYLTGK